MWPKSGTASPFNLVVPYSISKIESNDCATNLIGISSKCASAFTAEWLQGGNILGVVSLKDKERRRCFWISECFEKPLKRVFKKKKKKINTLTWGRFYAFFSPQDYNLPSGYNCLNLLQIHPSTKVYFRKLLCRFITFTVYFSITLLQRAQNVKWQIYILHKGD